MFAISEALSNPVLKRELVQTLRLRKSAWVLLAILIALAWTLLSAWKAQGPGVYGMSQVIFSLLTQWTLNAVALIAPALTAVSITREREEKTLDLLTTANLSPEAVLLGKLFASLGYVLLLFLIASPFFAVVLLLGGVSVWQFLFLIVFVILFALSFGLAGMAASAWLPSSMSAISAAMIYTAVAAWLPLFLSKAVGSNVFPDAFGYLCPVAVANWIAQGLGDSSVFRGSRGPTGAGEGLGIAASLLIAQGIVMAMLARVGYLRGAAARRVRSAPVIDDPEVLRQRREQFPYYLIDPRRRRPPVKDHENPVARKDSQTLLVGHQARIIRSAYAAALLSIFLGALYRTGTEAWVFIRVVYFGGCAAAALAAILAVHGDRKGASLDLLRVTDVTPRQLLHAKLAIPMRFGLAMMAACLPVGFYIGAWMTGELPWKTPGLTGAIMLFALEGCAMGALAGACVGFLTRRLGVAIVLALAACCLATAFVETRIDGFDLTVIESNLHRGRTMLGRLAPDPAVWARHLIAVVAPCGLALYLIGHTYAARCLAPQEH